MNEYEDSRQYIKYGEGATFIRRCEICKRFVKADKTVFINDYGLKDQPNATCSKHGRVKMIFLGFI